MIILMNISAKINENVNKVPSKKIPDKENIIRKSKTFIRKLKIHYYYCFVVFNSKSSQKNVLIKELNKFRLYFQ
jgi:hypothetical protein